RAPQRRDDAERAVQPRGEVRERHATLDWRAPRLSGDAHDAAHRLDGQVESAFLRAWPRLSVRGDRAIDQRAIELAQCAIANAEPVHHAGAVVLYQDMRGRRET